MSDELVLYHNPMSRGRISLWMLEELGVPYRLELLSFEKLEHKTPEYLALNPMGKIPTLVHDGVAISESPAIVTYLADAFPAAGLAPAIGDRQRGPYLRWMFFSSGCLEPAIAERMFQRPPVARKGAIGYGSYEDTLAVLEQALRTGPFILGERFSAADVMLASQLAWGVMLKAVEPRPVFSQYLAQVSTRDGYRRAELRNRALLEAQKPPA